ncbi:L-rhamnose mutarotase [Dysgonomonas alginatilytica]|uniref:L-rhamnose mutarotase n=1 Tax=Dysgonomonas alginatilytica TaxID=1605892 RepID=UPI000D754165|nr:L-rhamnose mutarotase [Dysgonomonas alginatilytica]
MDIKTSGYKVRQYAFPTKRYCQTLDLKNDPQLIEEYVKRHSNEEHWDVIRQGLRKVGILEMEIYLLDNRLFMIVETKMDFDWSEAFIELADMPKQKEWEEYMSIFQNVQSGITSGQKWKLMDRIFRIYE